MSDETTRPALTPDEITALREMLDDASEWIDERYSGSSKRERLVLWHRADDAVDRLAQSSPPLTVERGGLSAMPTTLIENMNRKL